MIGNVRQICVCFSAVRHLRTSAIYICRGRSNPNNDGVYRRLKALQENEADIGDKPIDLESFEELEADFINDESIFDDVESGFKRMSKAQELKMIQRKHFRPEKEPNMMTWSEKEQIKFLSREDPVKWTPETLAESFPASPDIIKKILKARWKPSSSERVKFHDRQVSANWIAFHQGKLQVHDPRLKTHLAKFKDRKHGVRIATDEEAQKASEIIFPKPKRTEFLSLITAFKPQENHCLKQLEESKSVRSADQYEAEKQLRVIKNAGASYTLHQYQSRLKEEVSKMANPPEELQAIIQKKDVNISQPSGSLPYVAPSERFKVDAVVVQKSKRAALEVRDPNNVPGKIHIPKDMWKRGVLYRVDDSFYSDKGEFLYRVPGLKL